MKKRSLFAAVAMLIVSAIVLTSATYAWFASNSTARVEKIGATVTNADGSLLVKATGDYAAEGSDFKGKLEASDYPTIPTTLYPVSFELTGGATAGRYTTITGPKKVAYDGSAFTAGSFNTAREWQVYSFDVQYKTTSTSAKKVTLTPTVSRGGCNFAYIYVQTTFGGTTNGYLYGGSGDNYYPVNLALGSNVITDAKTGDPARNNAIIDTTPDGASGYLGTQVTSLSSVSAIDLMTNLTATSTTEGEGESQVTTVSEATYTASVTVYVWAEGNDADCTGPQNANGIGVEFALAAVNPT